MISYGSMKQATFAGEAIVLETSISVQSRRVSKEFSK